MPRHLDTARAWPAPLEPPVAQAASEIARCEQRTAETRALLRRGDFAYPEVRVVLDEFTRLHALLAVGEPLADEPGACVLRDGLARLARAIDGMGEEIARAPWR